MADRRRHGGEADLDLARDQIGHGRPVAAIRHVLQIEPGHFVEQLSRQMARRADAGRGVTERFGLGVGDELRNGLHRDRRIDFKHVGHADDACYRRGVADEVEAEFRIKRRVGGDRRRHHEQRVAVRRRLEHGFGADIAAGAWPVFDDELLAEFLRQPAPISRDRMSVVLPAAKPTMMRTGCAG